MADLACGHYQNTTRTRCGAAPARPYLTGPRCTTHTPAAQAGRPEPAGGYCAPLRCYCGHCPSYEPPPPVIQLPRRRTDTDGNQEKGAA